MFGPPTPRVSAMNECCFVHRGMCRGYFVKRFIAAIPWKHMSKRMKIGEEVRQAFAAFFPVSAKQFRFQGLCSYHCHRYHYQINSPRIFRQQTCQKLPIYHYTQKDYQINSKNNFGSGIPPPELPNIIPTAIRQGIC